MSRALVLGSGGLRGAYSAGVAATLCRNLGPDHFDAIYGSSAGACTGSYYAAGQPTDLEQIWRKYVHGSLLVNLFNSLCGKNVLDLDYLIGLFRYGPFQLRAKMVIGRVCIVVTDRKTGAPRYHWPTDASDVFQLLKATTAIPFFHPMVRLRNRDAMDGALTDPLPVARALADGHEHVTVVCNKPRIEPNTADQIFLKLVYLRYRKHWKGVKALAQTFCRVRKVETLLENKVGISVIRPQKKLPFRWALDSSKERINYAFDLGVNDALAFLKT